MSARKSKGRWAVMKKVLESMRSTAYRFFYSFSLVWKTNPWLLLCMVLVAVIQGIVPVISSLISTELMNLLQLIIVDHAAGKDIGSFWESGIVFLVIFLFSVRLLNRLATRLSAFTARVTGEHVVRTVKLLILEKAKQIDIASYDTPEFYEKLENANREAGTRPVSILQNTFKIVSTVISFVSYMVILMSAVPLAGLAVVLVTVPSAVVNFIYRKKNAEYMKRSSKGRREMAYYSNRSVDCNAAKEIRLFGLSDTLIESYKQSFQSYYHGLRKLIVRENIWQTVFIFTSVLTNASCYLYIAMQVFNGSFLIGDFSLYTAAITTIANEITTLITTSASVYEGTLFIDNLITFLEEKPTVTSPISPVPPPAHGVGHTIEFCDVSFSYPGSERTVLSHVNLKINAGDNVTLVGLNGAGKTTLIKLMTRLYDPTEGRILLDGKDLRDYDIRELYSIYGIIFQDFGRYAYSVADNIRFGNVEAREDRQAIEQAAKASSAYDFIMELSDGFDTPLTRSFEPNGAELSGGQWQKIAIARAFYGDKDILILDEPTAALDPIAENEIYTKFTELSKGKTTLFVSHRLSSAVTASKIVVMENGRIAEEGTHPELMRLQGKYHHLFTTQATRYMEDASASK